MGSKLEAKALMEKAGVPVLPGATVDDSSDLGALAAEIGFPVLVKAAFGGGGRGMRVVHSPSGLSDAVEGARREAASAFGDGTVFLERFVVDPRHVEVQILGDTHGEVVSLFERECSIQRRYQKIVEESPSPAVDPALRAELGAAAVAAGKAIGYTGAGTVEFVMAQDGTFFFLEVNTRLQVEHPVTELVTGLDLVALQLQVAEGAPLPAEVLDARIDGHAIEVRLYAEDVPAGFLPATGTLHRFRIPALPGVRVDTGVEDGSVVSPHYDPMLAKVIAHGRTREAAARTLARALRQAEIHGVTTNRDLLVDILREAEFLAGRTDTGYLTRHPPRADGTVATVHAVAAAVARQAENRERARVLGGLPSGWRNVGGLPQTVAYEGYEVAYAAARRVHGVGERGTPRRAPARREPGRRGPRGGRGAAALRCAPGGGHGLRGRTAGLRRAGRDASLRRSERRRARRVPARPDARWRGPGARGRGRPRDRGPTARGARSHEDGAHRGRAGGGHRGRRPGGARGPGGDPAGPGGGRVTAGEES
jgi:propionyl-CoA carboxylase alpha chain